MRMVMKTLSAMVAAVLLGVVTPASADQWADPSAGYVWNYRITNDDTVELVVDYFSDSSVAVAPMPTGAMKIPATIGGRLLVGIGSGAFSGCEQITELEIPDGVIEIGAGAFVGCSSLTNVVVGRGVSSIGASAFSGCAALKSISVDASNLSYKSIDGILYSKDGTAVVCCPAGKAGSVIIPDGVVDINDHAFSSCTGLTSIALSDSLKTIGTSAFSSCAYLTGVKIPGGVVSIGDAAFFMCENLAEVEIPDSVMSVGWGIFSYCSSLAKVVVGDGVPVIGDYMFSGCESLKTVEIPASVRKIESNAFEGCSNLANVTISDGVEEIGYSAFEGCSGLTGLNIPASIKMIGGSAFEKCSQLQSIEVDKDNPSYRSIDGVLYNKTLTTLICCPGGKKGVLDIIDGVINIENNACEGCMGLTAVNIPDSVEYIGHGAFSECSSLSSVAIPDGVEEIEYSMFSECAGLTSVSLPEGITMIGDYAFSGCTKLNGLVIPSTVTEIGYSTFEDCCELASIEIPADVSEIGMGAFDGCLKMKSIDVDESNQKYKSIDGVLYDKAAVILIRFPEGKVGSFEIPDTVETIEEGAFEGCAGLVEIGLSKAKEIRDRAFDDCSGLATVAIPQSVRSIGDEVFSGCTGLNAIDVANENLMYKSIDGVLYNKSGTRLIRCPEGRTGTFTVPDTVIGIEDYAFEDCVGLMDVVLPNSVTSIGTSAFNGCKGLTGFTVPKSVTDFGLYSFSGCRMLRSLIFKGNAPPYLNLFLSAFPKDCVIYVPQESTGWGVQIPGTLAYGIRIEYGEPSTEPDPDDRLPDFTIEDGVLTRVELNGAKSISIPSSVRKIGDNVFSGSEGLTSVVIPSSVTIIGAGAFRNCKSLENVEFENPSGLKTIGREAFQHCESLRYFELPASVTNIDGNVFAFCFALQGIAVSGAGGTYKDEDGVLYSGDKTRLLTVPGAITNLTIAATVTQINEDAFSGCAVLRSVRIPEVLKWSVADDLFRDCPEALQIEYYADARQNLEFYTPEGWPSSFFLTDKMGSTNSIVRIPFGNPIYSAYAFRNANEGAGMPGCFSNALLLAENGSVVYEEFRGQRVNKIDAFRQFDNLQSLEPGEYTARVLLNEPRMVYEASYIDNSNSVNFVVVPSTEVTFMSEGNTVAVQCFEKGAAYGSLPAAPLRYGYDFAGWFTSEDGDSMVTVTSIVPDSPITLYARWDYRATQATYVSGAISSNSTWRTGDSYVIVNNVSVSDGVTLTIEPGVTVKFYSGKSLVVDRGGTLSAIGTRLFPIVFTSIRDDANGGDTNGDGATTSPQPGDWCQIEVSGIANFDYCHVLYNSSQANYGGIEAYGGTVNFNNSEIAHTKYECVNAHSSGYFTARNSMFWDSSLGFGYYGSGRVKAYNCVFVGLTSGIRQSGKVLVNCIFYECLAFTDQDGDGSTFRNCCFYNPPGYGAQSYKKCGKNGNIWADPLFVDPDNGDFRIAANSPCVDAGDGAFAPEKDYFGQARRDVKIVTDSGVPNAAGVCPDIGIHEVLWEDDDSPYDIAPSAVAVDKTSVKIGDALKVSWTIQNVGTEDVIGGWHDAISLVSESGQSVQLGEALTTYTLKRGNSFNVNATFAVPVLSEGKWYARVTANSRRSEVPEGRNTTNNVMTAAAPITVALNSVSYADGDRGTLSAGGSTVVKFTFPEGTTGQIARVSVPAGLSVSYGLGFMPQGAYASGTMTATEKGEAIFHVPAGTTEVYLVMDAAQSEGQNYSVSFEAGDLAILSVSPNAIPPDEIVSITLDGIGLDNVANIVMSLDSGGSIPTRVSYTSKERVVIEVDGEGLVAGSEMQISIDSVVVGKVLVSSGGRKENIWARLIVPDSVREGRAVACYVEYGNSGDKSGTLPIFEVIADEPCKLRYTGDETWREVLRFFGVGGSENADMLLPGEVRRFEFLMKAGATNNVRLRMGDGQTYGIKDCDTVLVRKTVRRLSRLGVDATDYSIVGNIAQLVSQNPDTLIVTGFAVNTYGEPCDGVGVHIVASESAEGIFSSAVTDRNGFFYMTGITNGVYRFESADSVIVDGVDEFVVMNSDIGGKMIVVENSLSFYVAITNLNEGETISATAVKESDDTVYGSVMITDGYVQFRGLPEGMYTLEVRSSLGRLCRMAVSLPKLEGDVIDVELHDACSFNGCFADFTENERGGILVFCPDGHVFFEGLDVEGKFSVSDVVPGDYTLITVTSDEARYCVTNITLSVGDSPNVVFEKARLGITLSRSNKSARKLLGSFWSDLVDNINAVKNGKESIQRHRRYYQSNLSKFEEYSKEFLSACPSCLSRNDQEFVERLRFNLSQYLTEINLLERAVAAADAGVNSDLLSNIMGAGSDFFSAMSKMMEVKNFGTTRAEFINGMESIVSDTVSFLEEVRKGEDVGVVAIGTITSIGDMIDDVRNLRQSLDRFSSTKLKPTEAVKEVLRMVSTSVDAYNNAVNLASKIAKTSPDPKMKALANAIVQGDKALGPARPLIDSIGKSASFILKLEKIGTDSTLAEWGRLRDAIRYEMQAVDDMNGYLNREIFSLITASRKCMCPGSLSPSSSSRSKCTCNEEDKNKRLEDSKKPKVPKSCDPNEMVGPEGTGEARYVQPGEWMTYTIYFENKTNATAAAQEVFVTNPLSEWLDWSTFEMGEVSFGNQIDLGLSGLNGGASEVQMNGTNFNVRTTLGGGADGEGAIATQGVAHWYLRIVDNSDETTWPADPYAGFLPPNDPDTHCGEGHLTYRIKVRDDAPKNVVITNSATIVFDYNAPIETDPSWWNTVGTFHDVELEVDGVMTNLTLIAGEPFGELPTPTEKRTGYTFDAWYTGENGTGTKAAPDAIVPTGDFSLYANWAGNPYKVRFNANGGTGTMPDQSFVYGTSQKLPANAFTRKMYAFVGWALSPDGAAVYADGQTVSDLAVEANSVVTLYAVWEKTQNELWPDGIEGAVPTTAASEYNGYLYDEKSGAVKGTIQVKVGKPGKKDGKASVKATVVVGAKKATLKAKDKGKAVINPDGPTEIELVGGEACTITLGAEGLSGFYGAYLIDGARNFFTSKVKAEANAANVALDPWKKTVNVVWEQDGKMGVLSLAIGAKGKTKVSGTALDGSKVSTTSQLLVGEEWLAVPVAYSKKGVSLFFVLWLERGGTRLSVEGLGENAEAGLVATPAKSLVFTLGNGFEAIDGVEDEMLPKTFAFTGGTKWSFAKADTVKLDSKTKELLIAKSNGNPSGLKLTYTAKTGAFKGSFKVYTVKGGKLKKLTANVTGIMIGGVGYGSATIKGVGTVSVRIN